MHLIKSKGMELMKSTPNTFYKMNDKMPNFWRDITSEHSQKYGVPVIKQSMYFFHWNGEKDLFELINRRWRIFKILGGKPPEYGSTNFPCDGYLDRVQIVRYPSGTGYLAPHQDPVHNQRLFISGYLSQLDIDFKHGGFWALDSNNNEVCLEPHLKLGDMGCGYANIVHGVNQIDDASDSERWFLGLYTNDSDLVKNRITLTSPAKQTTP